jgi:hypothetical protein
MMTSLLLEAVEAALNTPHSQTKPDKTVGQAVVALIPIQAVRLVEVIQVSLVKLVMAQ